MKLVIVSSYPPQVDGIAVFTADLKQALDSVMIQSNPVIAIVDDIATSYGSAVVGKIIKNEQSSYFAAAININKQYDCVLLQHEYGLFGGGGSYAGSYIVDFAKSLTVPLVTVFHSVLDEPDEHKFAITRELIERSAAIIVMSDAALHILERHYSNSVGKISVIPHGVPTPTEGDKELMKSKLNATARFTLLTFGLLRPSKGVELGIKAVAKIKPSIPNVLYWIVGQQDASTKQITGRDYLTELQQLVQSLDLEENVRFVSEFVSESALSQYLLAADVYLMLHQKRDQVSSGTLARAIGNAIPIIATATPLVEEMLASGGGILVPFGDVSAISQAIVELHDIKRRAVFTKTLSLLAKSQRWPIIAHQFQELVYRTLGEHV